MASCDPPEEIELNNDRSAPEANDESTPEGRRVLERHFASTYDSYLRMKSLMARTCRERIMKFMRQDIDNRDRNAEGSRRDEEGGYIRRLENSTYDGLLYLFTIVLGFVMRSPVYWLLGLIFFFTASNYKRSTIKWAIVNGVLAVMSIIYALVVWNNETTAYYFEVRGHNIIMFDYSRTKDKFKWESALTFDGATTNEVVFNPSGDLKWYHLDKDVDSEKHRPAKSPTTKAMLVDLAHMPDKGSYLFLNHKPLTAYGMIQFGAYFKSSSSEEQKHIEYVQNDYYPKYSEASETPDFDISLRCTSEVDKSVFWIGTSAIPKADETTVDTLAMSQVFKLPVMCRCNLVYRGEDRKSVV